MHRYFSSLSMFTIIHTTLYLAYYLLDSPRLSKLYFGMLDLIICYYYNDDVTILMLIL